VAAQTSGTLSPKAAKLSIAFHLLTALLAMTPILAVGSGSFAQHLIALAAVIMLATSAMNPQGELSTTAPLLKPFFLAVLFPILWMTLQAIPLPFDSIANPIWLTTRTALNEPSLTGHISLDPGATLRSLASYLTILSLVGATAILTRDRQRAETTLLVLSTVTTLISFEALVGQLDLFAGLIPRAGTTAASPLAAAAALGVLINGAVIFMVLERHLKRTTADNRLAGSATFGLVLGLSGIAISLAAISALAQGSLFAATALGFLVIPFVAIVRRLDFRSWPSAILLAALIAMAGAASLPNFQSGPSVGLLAFIPSAAQNSASLTISQRALSDASWLGSGVGTFGLLSRAYQDFGVAPALVPASTAVSIAIEWGRPALVILAVFATQFFLFALRGAVRRGRDSFFCSAAAAGVVLIVCESLLDSSLLNPAVQILVAVLVGLGLSQSRGRTSA
jgi:hypothetical protein